MEKKKFLVLGHARSGTGFMAKLFQLFGYDVQHEMMGKDGISSWMFAVDDYQWITDLTLHPKEFTFDYIIMCIRHPIDIVRSVYHTEDISLDFRKKHVDLNGLNSIEMAIKSVLEWYKMIELHQPVLTVHIDRNPEEQLYHFLKQVEKTKILLSSTKLGKVNSREYDFMDYNTIKESCNDKLVSDLEDFCKQYNYPIPH